MVKKQCKICSALNSSASKKCTTCGVYFSKWSKEINTKAFDDSLVSTSDGRPISTKGSDGCFVGRRRKLVAFDESVDLPFE